MTAVFFGILILGLEALLVRTGPQIDLCRQSSINGPGEFVLVTLVYLAILLIIHGVIDFAQKFFKNDRSLLIILTTFGIFGTLGLAFFAGSLLNLQDCGLTGY